MGAGGCFGWDLNSTGPVQQLQAILLFATHPTSVLWEKGQMVLLTAFRGGGWLQITVLCDLQDYYHPIQGYCEELTIEKSENLLMVL